MEIFKEDYKRKDGEIFRIRILKSESKLIRSISHVTVINGEEYEESFDPVEDLLKTPLSEIIETARGVINEMAFRKS